MLIWQPSQSTPVTPRLKYKRKNRWKFFISALPILLLILIAVLTVSQIGTIRQFFGQANGEEANVLVDTQAVLGPVPRPWRNLAQGGEQFDWQLAPLVGQVKALHPQYIRLDHIYDFYDIVHGAPGSLSFDFSKLDRVLDDIQATGAKPYIALSYMPPVLTKGDIVDKPVNWSDWQLVVQKTIEHISGSRHTSDVYYEVWNEPDLFGKWNYYGDKNYLTLYEYASQGAVNARGVQSFKIGGPATTALYKNWFDALLKDVIDKHLRLDFFSWHQYSQKLDQYKQDMYDARTWMQSYPQLENNIEFHITEWGHDSNNNAGYDTSYGAAHTVAASISMVGVVEHAFVFEIQDGKDPAGQTYWGRWGLFTSPDAGAKAKPRYYALRMLDQIGTHRLQVLGNGTWVKALAAQNDEGTTQVVLANYDPAGNHSEVVPITYSNIQPGSYSVNREFLDGRKQVEKVATSAAVLQINVAMSANSVAFVELKKE